MNANDTATPQERIRKRVGGRLSNLDPLRRLEALRENVRALKGGPWRPRRTMERAFEGLLAVRSGL